MIIFLSLNSSYKGLNLSNDSGYLSIINCNLLFIQCEKCKKEHEGCCSSKCISIKNLPKEKQEEIRKGQQNRKRFHSHSKVDLSKILNKENND